MEQNHMLPPLLESARDQQQKSLTQCPPPYDSPPSSTATTSSATVSKTYSFPEPPDTALPPIQPAHHDHEHSLPSLSSVTAGASLYRDTPRMSPPPTPTTATATSPSVTHWPSMNPLTQFYTPSHLQSPHGMDLDPASPGYVSRGNSVSLDDPDVRMAAEALGDLRADFVSSPPTRPSTLPGSPATPITPKRAQPSRPQPEPLLSLLTTAHPVLGNTIESATSAYTSGKNFSPRFKTGAEYVEGYVTPVANTVGSIGRVTGIEGGVRWFLKGKIRKYKARKQQDLEKGESHKRRKVGVENGGGGGGNTAAETGQGGGARPGTTDTLDQDPYDRRLSVGTIETLPAYDDARSPAYAETDIVSRTQGQQPWQSRLIMSTSGLSIAMSEESLRSLKYCLQWLRWANSHIGRMITALKEALEQYDSVQLPEGKTKTNESQLEAKSKIIQRISALKSDVLKTLQDVIRTVSTYAGGALPDNARDLVRRQLTSLPQRFRLAQSMEHEQEQEGDEDESSSVPDRSVRDGAQKVLVLAKEGLDMMVQVSGVVDGTIVSAEEWCERLGKKRRASNEGGRAERPVVFADEKKPVLDSGARANRNGDVAMQGT